MAHELGSDLNVTELQKVVRSAYMVGDCLWDMPGHHGTPIQRECATVWAANLGLSQQQQQQDGNYNSTTILTPLEFRDAFYEVYDLIVNVNTTICGELLLEDTGDNEVVSMAPTTTTSTPTTTTWPPSTAAPSATRATTMEPSTMPLDNSSSATTLPTQLPSSSSSNAATRVWTTWPSASIYLTPVAAAWWWMTIGN